MGRSAGSVSETHRPEVVHQASFLLVLSQAFTSSADGIAIQTRNFADKLFLLMMNPCRSDRRITWQRPLAAALLFGLLGLAPGGLARADTPAITKVTLLPTRQLELQFALNVGESYTVEVSTNLVDWVAVGGIEQAPASSMTVIDENTVDLAPALFLRLKVGRYTRFSFGFAHYVQAGDFTGSATTPSVSLPAVFNGYRAMFEAEGDAPYPESGSVFFTGPSGSGASVSPASAEYSETEEGWYVSEVLPTTFGAPAGTWTVNYRGTNMTFTSQLDALSRLVVPVPTVMVANGRLQSVSWVYRDRVTGAALTSPPSYLQQISVQVEGFSGRLYDSPDGGAPTVTTHTLTEPVTWSDVTGLNLAYDDTEDHHYVIFFRRQ